MPIWLAAIMMALGTAAQQKQTKEAGKRSLAEIQLGREKESTIETAQRADVMEEGAQFDPALRQEALDVKAAETEARIGDALSANELITTGDVGDLPDKLLAQRAASTRDKANTASIMAALNAKTQAPRDTAFDEGQGLSELLAASRGRSSKLGRVDRTAKTLAGLEGQTDSKAMMLAGIMQQLGMAGASGSIMSGMMAPGAAAAGVGANMTPVPGYTPPDAFGVAGIR